MRVRIKKLHPDAVIPAYAKPGDAGMDLTAIGISVNTTDHIYYKTGLSVEIPEGYVGLIFARSNVTKMSLVLGNSVGVIDSGYRGEIEVRFSKLNPFSTVYQIGDRVAQLVVLPCPVVELEEVDELSTSDRGNGGFGSTGL